MISRVFLGLLFLFATNLPITAAEEQDKRTGKSVALILDASGSMQAKLKNGTKRIDAAKAAVKTLINNTPANIRLALRAYGHQSHRRKKNCKDTQLLTNFKPIGENKDEVIAKALSLKAQGYTPISLVLELAANDLKAEQQVKSRIVTLVSDGKETCEGDPCAVARALAAADADLVIHTIGFAVDVAARYELQCIAKAGRGTYFEADNADKLAEKLSTAVKTVAIDLPKPIKVTKKKPGHLTLKNTTASSHKVYNSETGKEVGKLSAVTPSIELPAGFYKVKFGNAYWRSIEITDSETTTIETAIIKLPNASFRGQKIVDWETNEEIGKLSSSRNSMNLLPSSFNIMFGKLAKKIVLNPGEVKTIQAGSVKFKGLPINSRYIYDKNGNEVTSVSATHSSATLPPGDYVLEHNDQKYPFTIPEGAQEIKVQLK